MTQFPELKNAVKIKRREILPSGTLYQSNTRDMFPSDWAERKGASVSKRRKIQQKEELKSLLEECETTAATDSSSIFNIPLADSVLMTSEDHDSVVDVIKRQVNTNKFAPAIPEEIQLDHVLSSVPYQAMLESLFGGVSGPVPDVPLVTKTYEESFMRESCGGERACAMGDRCECMFIDKNAPFVGTEFLLRGETNTEKEPKMCVLCCRRTTQKLFFDVCYSGKRVQGLIQHYGNLCNQPGEYARECMLICPPGAQWHGMPLPIMSHQRNRYRVVIVAGIKHLEQLRVSYEDFATPSDKAQA